MFANNVCKFQVIFLFRRRFQSTNFFPFSLVFPISVPCTRTPSNKDLNCSSGSFTSFNSSRMRFFFDLSTSNASSLKAGAISTSKNISFIASSCFLVNGVVTNQYTSKGTFRIPGERVIPALFHGRSLRDTTYIGVFDNCKS